MRFGDLNTLGWALIKGISSRSELLDLGKALGCPEPTPNGEMIKEIRVTPAAKAPSGSQSSIYGTGPFPLHTDTVFWPVPVRYVILRASGDMRRPTTVMGFAGLLQGCDTRFSALIEQSIWLAGTRSKRFYCSLRFRRGDVVGWRYDGDLMSPVNAAAVEVSKVLRPLTAGARPNCVDWCADVALVLSNWSVLHGRGPEPPEEGNRIIERLYVR
jgi:hypothetical protein